MHHRNCISSDGDWICAGGCTHDKDEDLKDLRQRAIRLEIMLRSALRVSDTQGGCHSLDCDTEGKCWVEIAEEYLDIKKH